MNYVIGLDIGTTSTIGILIALPSTVAALESRPVTLSSPHAGWAEEDPAQWWGNACEIIRSLLERSGVSPAAVKAVGVSGMLPAIVLLDADGKVLRPAIQQSDGRAGHQVAVLKQECDEAVFIARTGNGINQQLATAKLRWLEENEPATFARIATVFGSYDFVNFKLTGIRSVDQNWGLEAGFVDIASRAIDDQLVALAHIARDVVPELHASHSLIGTVSVQAAAESGLLAGTPVVAGAADHVASAYAAGIVQPGDVLLKFGGAIDVLASTDLIKPDSRLFLDFHLIPGLFMPNGCMSTGGSGLNWFIDNLAGGLQADAATAGVSPHQYLDRLATNVPAGSDGLTFLPYFLGEKTPIHDASLRGTLTGLSFTHGMAHVWRALLEGYGYAIAHHLEVLRDMGHAASNVVVSDGGSQSDIWMQIVADILQLPLQRLNGHSGSSLGAALTAAVGVGLTDDWSVARNFVSNAQMVHPDPAKAEVYGHGYRRFRDLHHRLTGFES